MLFRSKFLKAVNEETNLSQLEKLRALASVLDKHREVSIQEAVSIRLKHDKIICESKILVNNSPKF